MSDQVSEASANEKKISRDDLKEMARHYAEDRLAFLKHVVPDSVPTHAQKVFDVAKLTLQGFLSGPNFNVLLVNAMTGGVRKTLGQIIVDEAWDMAEALVEKYESVEVTPA